MSLLKKVIVDNSLVEKIIKTFMLLGLKRQLRRFKTYHFRNRSKVKSVQTLEYMFNVSQKRDF